MEHDLRFFARLRAAQLACPGCGRLVDLRTSGRGKGETPGGRTLPAGVWDPLTGRFACRCGLELVLGVCAYIVGRREPSEIPSDWRPTLEQAAGLRDLARGRVSQESWKMRRSRKQARANQVREGDPS